MQNANFLDKNRMKFTKMRQKKQEWSIELLKIVIHTGVKQLFGLGD